MEEIKNNEKGCCGSTSKCNCGCGCSCCKQKWIKMILAVVAVLIIFSVGVCVGRHAGGFEGRGGYGERFGWNQTNETCGCNMMRNGLTGNLVNDKTATSSAPTVTPVK